MLSVQQHVMGGTFTQGGQTIAFGRITRGSYITYYSLMLFIAYTFKGQVHVFAG